MSGKQIGLIIINALLYFLCWPAGVVMTIIVMINWKKAKKEKYIITDETGKTYTITKEQE